MPTRDLVILMNVFALIVFFVIFFFFPLEEKRRKRKKQKLEEAEHLSSDEKKWQDAALQLKERLAKHRQEIEQLNNQNTALMAQIHAEQDKAHQLHEKLKREKKWFSEQEANLGKRTQEMRQVKMDLIKAQTDREKEYSLRLAADREKKELRQDFDKTNKEKQEAILKITNLEFSVRVLKEEIAELKKSNAQLLKKKNEEESQWVARSEFLKLEQQLKDKVTELEHIKKKQHEP